MFKPIDSFVPVGLVVNNIMSTLRGNPEMKTYTLSWWEKNWMDDEGEIICEWHQCKKEIQWDGGGDTNKMFMDSTVPQERKDRH